MVIIVKHISDPDEIIISKLTAKIRHRVINEHLSAGFIHQFEVAHAKLTQNQLSKSTRSNAHVMTKKNQNR